VQCIAAVCGRYEIMTRCWCEEPSARPTFSDVCVSIEHIVDAAEHLPLPGPSDLADLPAGPAHLALPGQCQSASPGTASYCNDTAVNSDDDDDDDVAAPLYRNCV